MVLVKITKRKQEGLDLIGDYNRVGLRRLKNALIKRQEFGYNKGLSYVSINGRVSNLWNEGNINEAMHFASLYLEGYNSVQL